MKLTQLTRRRITLRSNAPQNTPLPSLRDAEQPFIFNIRPQVNEARKLTHSNYRLEFYDTSYAEESYTALKPSMVILCYSVTSRESLKNVRNQWKPLVDKHFDYHDHRPVMLLGLQRDLRTAEREERPPPAYGALEINGVGQYDRKDIEGPRPFKCVLPEEGLQIAQEMRADRYAECSALTGELCKEVFQDIVQMAVGTTKGAGGGKTEQACAVM